MRFRFTIFLLLANIALFVGIWKLERQESPESAVAEDSVPFTRLEIYGKNIDQARILSFENNKWRIISPIEWSANLFAVNRIRNQLEFLGKETSFPASELKKHGHSLAEYGLDDPAFTLKYGNGKKMSELRIGKNAPIGDRVYMLDCNTDSIVIVDKAFVDGLVLDLESLRNQAVFDIPPFEISSFSIRLPKGDAKSGKITFGRIGLIKDTGKWKFETPIVAAADPREVDAFLNGLTQISAKGFVNDAGATRSFDMGALPASITLQGTNRRQVLLLGEPVDGDKIYARLEDNNTVFILDAAIFKNLANLQTDLRDKRIMRFEPSEIAGIDITRGSESVKLRKLKSGVWDVIGSNKGGDILTANADLAIVNDLLFKLEKLRARAFVSDAPSENVSEYGLDSASLPLQIVLTHADQSLNSVRIGSEYKQGAVRLAHASVDKDAAIYGISRELPLAASTDFYHYRSRMLAVIPAGAVLNKISISEIKTKKTVFEAALKDGKFTTEKSLDARQASALNSFAESLKKFTVKAYLKIPFSAESFENDGKDYHWSYKIDISYELSGSGGETSLESRSWLITRRLGGTTQYGGSDKNDAIFELSQPMIDSLSELVMERTEPASLQKEEPQAPKKLDEELNAPQGTESK